VLGSARKKQEEEDTRDGILPREDHRHRTNANGIDPSPVSGRIDHAPLPSA